MNILYHYRTRGTGGESVHASGIINALRRLGHHVLIASPTGTDPTTTTGEDPFKGKSRGKGWLWISRFVPQFLFELLEIAYNFIILPDLLLALNRHRISFIYERYAFFLFAGALSASLRRVPLLVEVNELSGHERLRRQVFTRPARLIERWVFARASAILVVSEFLKREIIKMGIEPRKIHVVPNAVDVRTFQVEAIDGTLRRELGLNGKFALGFVGWFVSWHNLEMLVRCCARIIKQRPQMRLMLVGSGPLRETIEAIAEQQGATELLVFTGSVHHKQIPSYIAVMDACVIPHSNEYRSPIKMFEYMAMGKPVIAPSFEPITSVIEDGKTGIIFAAGDESRLEQAILSLIDQPLLRSRLGQMARQKVFSRYTWDHQARRALEIFEKVQCSTLDLQPRT